MSLQDFLIGLIIFVGGTVSIICFRLGLQILRADPEEYRINRETTRNYWSAVFGRPRPFRGGDVDRERTGLIVDKRTGQFMEVGVLTEDAIDRILRR